MYEGKHYYLYRLARQNTGISHPQLALDKDGKKIFVRCNSDQQQGIITRLNQIAEYVDTITHDANISTPTILIDQSREKIGIFAYSEYYRAVGLDPRMIPGLEELVPSDSRVREDLLLTEGEIYTLLAHEMTHKQKGHQTTFFNKKINRANEFEADDGMIALGGSAKDAASAALKISQVNRERLYSLSEKAREAGKERKAQSYLLERKGWSNIVTDDSSHQPSLKERYRRAKQREAQKGGQQER